MDKKFRLRLKLLVITFVLAIICIPLAFIITVYTNPFWLWFEKIFSIESTGHSGPAEWCYITVYLLLVIVSLLIMLKTRDPKQLKDN